MEYKQLLRKRGDSMSKRTPAWLVGLAKRAVVEYEELFTINSFNLKTRTTDGQSEEANISTIANANKTSSMHLKVPKAGREHYRWTKTDGMVREKRPKTEVSTNLAKSPRNGTKIPTNPTVRLSLADMTRTRPGTSKPSLHQPIIQKCKITSTKTVRNVPRTFRKQRNKSLPPKVTNQQYFDSSKSSSSVKRDKDGRRPLFQPRGPTSLPKVAPRLDKESDRISDETVYNASLCADVDSGVEDSNSHSDDESSLTTMSCSSYLANQYNVNINTSHTETKNKQFDESQGSFRDQKFDTKDQSECINFPIQTRSSSQEEIRDTSLEQTSDVQSEIDAITLQMQTTDLDSDQTGDDPLKQSKSDSAKSTSYTSPLETQEESKIESTAITLPLRPLALYKIYIAAERLGIPFRSKQLRIRKVSDSYVQIDFWRSRNPIYCPHQTTPALNTEAQRRGFEDKSIPSYRRETASSERRKIKTPGLHRKHLPEIVDPDDQVGDQSSQSPRRTTSTREVHRRVFGPALSQTKRTL